MRVKRVSATSVTKLSRKLAKRFCPRSARRGGRSDRRSEPGLSPFDLTDAKGDQERLAFPDERIHVVGPEVHGLPIQAVEGFALGEDAPRQPVVLLAVGLVVGPHRPGDVGVAQLRP